MEEKKKAVWITGASSGIGKALVEEFVSHNIHVIGTARRIELLEELKSSLGDKGDLLSIYQLDLSNYKAVREFCSSQTLSCTIELLINNAGITSFKKAIDDSLEDIEKIITTNLLGSIYTIKEILPEMIRNENGAIINILSVVTKKVFTSSSAYSASKAGLLAYANVLREEVRDKNIRIINISPGATATNIWPEGALKKYSDRMMKTEDIAKLVYLLFESRNNLVVEDVVIRPILGDL